MCVRDVYDSVRRIVQTSAYVVTEPGSFEMMAYSVSVSLVSMKLHTLCQPEFNRGSFVLSSSCFTALSITLLIVLFIAMDVIPKSTTVGLILILIHGTTIAIAAKVIHADLRAEGEFLAFLRRRIANPKRQSTTTKFGQFRPDIELSQEKQTMTTDLIVGQAGSFAGDKGKVNANRNAEEVELAWGKTPDVANFMPKESEGAGPRDLSGRLWVDRGVVGVPARREARSTTPEPFALAEARQSFAQFTKAMEVRSQSRAELSNRITQRSTTNSKSSD